MRRVPIFTVAILAWFAVGSPASAQFYPYGYRGYGFGLGRGYVAGWRNYGGLGFGTTQLVTPYSLDLVDAGTSSTYTLSTIPTVDAFSLEPYSVVTTPLTLTVPQTLFRNSPRRLVLYRGSSPGSGSTSNDQIMNKLKEMDLKLDRILSGQTPKKGDGGDKGVTTSKLPPPDQAVIDRIKKLKNSLAPKEKELQDAITVYDAATSAWLKNKTDENLIKLLDTMSKKNLAEAEMRNLKLLTSDKPTDN